MALAKYPLHRSGLQITRVGFGSWAAGGGGWAFRWGPQDDRESLAAMRHAIDLGIDWIDSSLASSGEGHEEYSRRRSQPAEPIRRRRGRTAGSSAHSDSTKSIGLRRTSSKEAQSSQSSKSAPREDAMTNITRRFHGRRSRSESTRLPPWQHLTRSFPVLSAGAHAAYPAECLDLRARSGGRDTDRVVELGGVSCTWTNGRHGGYSLCDAVVEVRHGLTRCLR